MLSSCGQCRKEIPRSSHCALCTLYFKLSLTSPAIVPTSELIKNKIYLRALSGKDASYQTNWDAFNCLQFEPDYVALADVLALALYDHAKDLSANNVSNEIMTTACRVLANT